MQIRPFLFPIIPGVLLLFSCDKDEARERDYPAIRTQAVNNITTEGARFNAIIVSGDIESISEYGFIWDNTDNNLNLQYAEKIMVNGTPGQESFSCEVTFALEAMEEYYVRPYIKSGDYTVYGEVVKFMSLGSQAPEITDFEPKSATWGDTVAIYGSNFTFQGNSLSVLFGTISASVIKSTNESIIVQVPDNLGDVSSELSVTLLGNISVADSMFVLLTFGVLNKVTPKTATWGDTLTLIGTFPINDHNVAVKVNGMNSTIINKSEDLLSISLPNTNYKDSVSINLVIDNHLLNSNCYVHLAEPFIGSIQQIQFGWEDTVNIYGLFCPTLSSNQVFFDNKAAKVLTVDLNKIQCIVPVMDKHSCQLSIRTGNVNLTYSEIIHLSGPVITKVTPSQTTKNGTVTITGKYFSPGHTYLYVNSYYYASINSITNRQIVATLNGPNENGPVDLTITVYDQTSTYTNLLTMDNPIITGISPDLCFYGDLVTITGDNFSLQNTRVLICNKECEITSLKENEIVFRMPFDSHCSTYITVNINGFAIETWDGPRIFPPQITEMTPVEGKPGDTIHITGDYFNPVFSNNTVYFNTTSDVGEVISGNKNFMDVIVPSLVTNNYRIEISSGCAGNYAGYFQCNSPWKFIKNLFNYQTYGSSLLLNNKLYILAGQNGQYGYYQTIDMNTLEVQFLPYSITELNSLYETTAFMNGEYGYVGIGKKGFETYDNSLYRINLTDNSWSVLNDFPGPERSGSFHFSIGAMGYMGTGDKNGTLFSDFWMYDTDNDTWTRKADFPGGTAVGAAALAYDNKGYIMNGKDLWQYDPVIDGWIKISIFPGEARKKALIIPFENGFYFGTGSEVFNLGMNNTKCYKDFWQYTFQTNTWKKLSDFPGGARNGVYGCFFNEKVYLIGGIYPNDNYFDSKYDLYEYDPDSN